MDELTLVARLREEYPAGIDLTAAEARLADEISSAATEARPRGEHWADARRGAAAVPGEGLTRGRGGTRRRLVTSAAVAAVAAALVAVVVAVAVPGHPGHRPPGAAGPPSPSVAPAPGPAATAAELVADATQVARTTPDEAPNPHGWVYTKTEAATSASHAQNGTLLGPINGTKVSQGWNRVDPQGEGFPGTWQGTSYSYFSSLPTDPAKLAAVIERNNKTDNFVIGGGYIGIFNTVEALLENPVVLPLKLRAALYAVLAHEPGVNFEQHVTDIAGRTDVAFFIDQEGYYQSEILINPTTYSYMGSRDVAYRAHTLPAQVNDGVASGPYTHIRAGQIMDEEALLQFGIVQRYGQLPR